MDQTKSALVTGASTGIGRAVSLKLVASGFQVFAGVRKAQDAESLKSADQRLIPVSLDVEDPTSIKNALTFVNSQILPGGEFSLVNNAGIVVPGPMEAVQVSQLRRQFEVNVFGLVEVTQGFLPLIRSRQGRIVNMSSVSGLSVIPFLGPYSASKFALEAISDAFRLELARFGVKVIVLEPGALKTPIWEKNMGQRQKMEQLLRDDRRSLYEEQIEKFESFVARVVEKIAADVSVASDAVYESLTQKNPPVRRVLGSPGNRLRVLMGRFLPDRSMDWMIQRYLK